MPGIVSYGAYLPYWRLSRSAIPDVLGSGGGRGTQRGQLRRGHHVDRGGGGARRAPPGAGRLEVPAVVFSTTAPAYLDKTNATAIHAALDARPRRPAPTTRSGRCGPTSPPARWPARGGPWPCSATSAPACPAAPTRQRGRCRRRDRAGRRPIPSSPTDRRRDSHRPSSSTGGARRATPSASVGGALRRARLRAARRGGGHRGAEVGGVTRRRGLDHVVVTGLAPRAWPRCGAGSARGRSAWSTT